MTLLKQNEPGVFFSETGAFHIRMKLEQCLGKLTSELFMRGIICPERPTISAQDFVIVCSDPSQSRAVNDGIAAAYVTALGDGAWASLSSAEREGRDEADMPAHEAWDHAIARMRECYLSASASLW